MDDFNGGDRNSEQDRATSATSAGHSSTEAGVSRNLTPWGTSGARVISLVSLKGGVGKTTSCVNLGAALALEGHSVLIVGVDPQCGICRSLGYGQENLDGGLSKIFTSSIPLTQLAYTTPLKSLFFVTPNTRSLAEEESYASLMKSQVETFSQEIDRARNLYDTILIDCPPGLSAITQSALLASDGYLIPVQAEELCRDSLGRLLSFIDSFRQRAYAETNLNLTGDGSDTLVLEGMFLTMVSSRTRMSRHVSELVRKEYAEHLLPVSVPRATRLTEMALRGKPAVIYNRKSPSSRAYFDLKDALLLRHQEQRAAAGGRDAAEPTGTDVGESPRLAVPTGESQTVPERPLSIADLLSDLRSGSLGPEGIDPVTGQPDRAELISLEDLIAEEEKNSDEEGSWEDLPWNRSNGFRRRSH